MSLAYIRFRSETPPMDGFDGDFCWSSRVFFFFKHNIT